MRIGRAPRRARRLLLQAGVLVACLAPAAVGAMRAAPAATGVPFPLPSHAVALDSAGAAAAQADGGPAWTWSVVSATADPAGAFPAAARLAREVDLAAGAAEHVVLRLETRPPGAGGGAEGEAAREARRRVLLSELRRVARAEGGRVAWIVVAGALPEADGAEAARLAAYEIKSLSVTLRAEAPTAGIGIAVDGETGADRLLAAYRESGDLDPYVDALYVENPRRAPAELFPRLARELLPLDPGLPLWARRTLPCSEDGVLTAAASAVAAGVDLVVFRDDSAHGCESGTGDPVAALAAFGRALPPALGVAPADGAGIRLAGAPAGVSWMRLFDEESFSEVLLVWSERPVEQGSEATWEFQSSLRRGYRLVDPVTGDESYLRAEPLDEETVRVVTPLANRPTLLVVTRRKVSPGFALEDEEADVTGVRTVRVEEVVALHQRWRAFQDDRLRTIRRDGRISFRPRFAQATGTFDITIEGRYFWDPSTGGEWVIGGWFLNGVRLNWDKIPEIPLVRWDQVIQAPLDLDLDKRYAYRLDGRETFEERPCWVLEFEPLDAGSGEALFRGRALIEETTGALVRVESVQTGLEPPVLSREETRVFRPYEGPDGTVYWLLDALDGQILQSVAGSNLVIMQQWRFGEPDINGAGFLEARAEGYASKSQMLRDTPEGFKWLERTEEGGRAVRQKPQTSQWFAAAGVLHDEGLGETIPLAGVNYVNVDLFERGLLFNMLFAGVLANVTLSEPALFDSAWDVGVNVNAIAITTTDRVFSAGEEIEPLRIGRRPQSIRLHAGHPIGDFVKLRGSVGFNWVDYSREDETDPGFTLPEDHLQLSTALAATFDRGGWGAGARVERVTRSDWEPWGAAGSLASAQDVERARDFLTWELSGTKSWFLESFQKIETQVAYQAGEDLDRFSALTFGFLSGTRLQGFGGSGIRYDRGVIADLEYEFNVRDIIRFEAEVAHARVRGIEDLRDSNHTGVGFAASFPGPWQTLIRLDVGYALASDIPEVEGDTELFLLVLRLF